MDLWQADKLILFVLFVVPGFISLKVYELLLPRASKSSSEQLIDAVAYSSINYAVLLAPIYIVETSGIRERKPELYVAFYVLALLAAPVCWALLLKWLRTTRLVKRALPHPTAKPWDYIFGSCTPYWIIVSLKDGTKIGGLYGSSSFASSSPAPEQLYLQEAWVLNSDGGFERPRNDTAGVMVLSAEIVTIEFFRFTTGDQNEREEAVERRLSTDGKGLPAAAPDVESGDVSGGISAVH